MAAMLLADQGVDVVSIRRPGKAIVHPVEFVLERNKRYVEIDLKTESGVHEALSLIDGADVVIENFRPGVLAKLGLGYEEVRKRNPQIIYVSSPGFASSDPRAAMQGWEGAISAAAALYTDISFWGAAFSLPPVFTALPLPSTYAALHAAIGTVAAVIGRLRDGRGDYIEAPLLDGAMSAAAGPLLRTDGQPKRYNDPGLPTFIIDHLHLRRIPQASAQFIERFLDTQMPPFFRNYRCGDGREVFITVIDNVGHIEKLLSAMDLADEIDAMGLRRGNVLDMPPSSDNIYAYRTTTAGLKKLAERIEKKFLTRSALEWEDWLSKHGVPAAVQRTTAEWAAFMPIRAAGIVVEQRDRNGDAILAPGQLVDVVASSHGSRELDDNTAAPRFEGWHAEQRFLANAPPPSAALSAPLDGLHILDLANVIAGPVASRALAELGASVLHIDPEDPKMGPRMLLWIGQEVNQGKQAAIIDLKADETRPLVDKLIACSDAIIYDKLPGQTVSLGVDPARVHGVNSGCVVIVVTAYGGSRGKGWEDRPAYDPVVQAMSGIMLRFGGLGTSEVHGVAAMIDYFTGFAGTLATLCGLVSRQRGAENVVTRTSLARMAAWVQIPFVTGRPVPEPIGQAERGWHALDRLYRTSDGWIYLAVEPENWSIVRTTFETALSIELPDHWEDAAGALAKAFDWHKTSEVVTLRSPVITMQAVHDVSSLRKGPLRDDWQNTPVTNDLLSERVLLTKQGGERGDLYIPDCTWLRWASRPRLRLHHLPGEDTIAVLRELTGSVPHELPNGVLTGWILTTGPLPA
ncbi:CoA transferase [Massilia sp. YIM B02763]|uniref:CoA transferase n=1 Tax=Massilia sp. YIM B02763 TaxID=3050130 RepID=UPI0025B6D17C|nr:CoA transferase [Massilia sp. YIM B02763]MDN4056441.1 CoA transferase [Massilia sp. YIM B02763]